MQWLAENVTTNILDAQEPSIFSPVPRMTGLDESMEGLNPDRTSMVELQFTAQLIPTSKSLFSCPSLGGQNLFVKFDLHTGVHKLHRTFVIFCHIVNYGSFMIILSSLVVTSGCKRKVRTFPCGPGSGVGTLAAQCAE